MITLEKFQEMKTQPIKERQGGKKVNWDEVKTIVKELQKEAGANTVDEVMKIANEHLINGAEGISRMRVRTFLEKECTKKRCERVFDGVRNYYRIK